MLMPLSCAMDFRRCKTVEASNIKMLPRVKQVYFLGSMSQFVRLGFVGGFFGNSVMPLFAELRGPERKGNAI